LLVVLLAVFVSAYNVFWGEFVHCDVGTCPYLNPEGRFLSINSTSIVFDTSGGPSGMGFYVVAVVLDKYASLSISGWWSYQLPWTMAYVVSDEGFSAMECSTGGGQVCSVSGVLSPGVYYIVLVDAWAQQTVRVAVSDGRLVLAGVSPQRVACALWRAGVLAGQRLTYAFHWPWGFWRWLLSRSVALRRCRGDLLGGAWGLFGARGLRRAIGLVRRGWRQVLGGRVKTAD